MVIRTSYLCDLMQGLELVETINVPHPSDDVDG